MRKSLIVLLLALGAVLAGSAPKPPPVPASTTADGICEATPQTGTETYTWYLLGSATLPNPQNPSSPSRSTNARRASTAACASPCGWPTAVP